MHEPPSSGSSQELEAFCQSCPAPEMVTGLLEELGLQLTFHMDAVIYPASSSTLDLPAQYHFRDEHGTELIYLAGKDSPLDGEHFPSHSSRFWVSPGADLAAYRRIVQALSARWWLTWQRPQTNQNLRRTA